MTTVLIPYTKVSAFHFGMFSAKSSPILLPSPFVKHPCIASALYKEMKVSAGQLSSLGAGPAAWLGLRSHVGSERERQRERNDVICALDLIYLNKKGNNMQKRWDPSLSISTPLFAKQASWRKRRDPRPYPCIWVCRLSDLCCSRWGSTFEGFGSNGDPCYLHLRRWCGRWSGQSAHRLGGTIHCGAIDLEKLKWKTRVSSNVDDTVMPHLTYCKKGGFLIKHHVQRDTYTCYEEGSHNTRSENKHVQRYMKLLRTTPQVCNFNPTFAVHSDTWHSNRSPWGTGAPVQGLYAAGEVTSCPCPRALVWDDGVEDYEGYLEINTTAKVDVGPSKRSRSFSCKDDFSIQHRFL